MQKNALAYKNKQEKLVNEIQLKYLNIYQNKDRIAKSIAFKNELKNQRYILTQDKIVRMKSADENCRRLKYLQLLKKHSKYNNIKVDRKSVV